MKGVLLVAFLFVPLSLIAHSATSRVELIENGSFEIGKEFPQGWSPLDSKEVLWETSDSGHGKCIHLVAPKKIAEVTGVMYYSDFIEVPTGETSFHLQLDVKRHASSVIVFIKGYGEFKGERQVVYKYQKRCRTKEAVWETQNGVFTIRSQRAPVRWFKVLLYTYHPEGEAWFDNVSIQPAPAADAKSTE